MHGNTTHGYFGTPTYKAWEGAKSRCHNRKCPQYLNYGARGIRFSSGWDKFEMFLADMGPKPSGHSLDRINNDGNYEPGNCRWVKPSVQIRNRGEFMSGRTLLLRAWQRWGQSFPATRRAQCDYFRWYRRFLSCLRVYSPLYQMVGSLHGYVCLTVPVPRQSAVKSV